MAKNRVLLVLEIVLLVAVSASPAGCGSSHASPQATPRATAPHRLDTGPLGLPLYCPKYVKHDRQGNLYVTDNDFGGPKVSHRARIVKLSPTGQLLATWGKTGSPAQRLTLPVGIDLDTQGDVYIGDLRNHRLVKFSPTGKVLAIWQRPMDLALFGITVDPQGNIYVVWTPVPNNGVLRGGIRKLSPSGAALANWPATCPPS